MQYSFKDIVSMKWVTAITNYDGKAKEIIYQSSSKNTKNRLIRTKNFHTRWKSTICHRLYCTTRRKICGNPLFDTLVHVRGRRRCTEPIRNVRKHFGDAYWQRVPKLHPRITTKYNLKGPQALYQGTRKLVSGAAPSKCRRVYCRSHLQKMKNWIRRQTE